LICEEESGNSLAKNARSALVNPLCGNAAPPAAPVDCVLCSGAAAFDAFAGSLCEMGEKPKFDTESIFMFPSNIY
jgi:hypothetical protein